MSFLVITFGSSVRGLLQARILEWVVIFPLDLPDPGIKPGSPALLSEPAGKPSENKAL